MTKYLYAGPPADYPKLGFAVLATGAVLDGTLSDPEVTTPPDARWSVYGGGSGETNIQRYPQNPGGSPSPPEPTDGFVLRYSDDDNAYVATDPAEFVALEPVAGAIDTAAAAAAGTVLDNELTTRVVALDADAESDLRVQADARLSATYASHDYSAALQKMDKTLTGIAIVCVDGMSIASFPNSPARCAAQELRNIYGDVGELYVNFGTFGGSPPNVVYQGIDKQPFGGPQFLRARMNPASTAQSFTFYGDTIDLRFSRESNAVAAQIKVDGANWATTPTAGAQAFSVLVAGAALTRGLHTITIEPPASGFSYPETLLAYDSQRTGVIVIDNTIGGSHLTDVYTPNAAGTVAEIPTVGDNGIGAFFARPVDLRFFEFDANDAPTYDDGRYITVFDKYLTKADEAGAHVVLITSMAGHYADPTDPDYARFAAIKALHKNRAGARSDLITYVPWDDSTRLPDADYDEYEARYYTLPDTIHPNTRGTRAGLALTAQKIGIPVPATSTVEGSAIENYRRPARTPRRRNSAVTTWVQVAEKVTTTISDSSITLNRSHNLSVGDVVFALGNASSGAGNGPNSPWYVVEVPAFNKIKISATPGGAVAVCGADQTQDMLLVKASTGLPQAPIGHGALLTFGSQRVTAIAGGPGANMDIFTNADVAASSTSDRFGKYLDMNSAARYFAPSPNTSPLAWTFRISPAVTFGLAGQGNITVCAEDGTLPATGNGSVRLAAETSSLEPVLVSVLLHYKPGGANEFAVISGRIYQAHLAVGSTPTLT